MNTYITHSGIGTEVNEISVIGLVQLVNKTELVRTKLTLALHEKGKNLNSEGLVLEDLECYEMPMEIIVECLNEIAKSDSFITLEDDDGYHYIMFVDRAPWEYTARERMFAKKDVEGYFKLIENVVSGMEIDNLYIANYIMD